MSHHYDFIDNLTIRLPLETTYIHAYTALHAYIHTHTDIQKLYCPSSYA